MITDYHPNGTLDKWLSVYKGKTLQALEAFRPLVEAVDILHKNDTIHRDIKTENIFVAKDNRLVLGDFGIVFYRDGQRLTETYERVGSRDWMAPWAHTGLRVDDVRENFDVFSLGKVLWCVISGQRLLPFWYLDRPQYDLTRLYPGDPSMHALNAISAHCIVQDEDGCWTSATDLLIAVDSTLEMLNRGGQPLTDGVPRPCRVCGVGQYLSEERFTMLSEHHPPLKAQVYSCWKCGHVQLFVPPKGPTATRIKTPSL
jgi:serine/threonine protein kinase